MRKNFYCSLCLALLFLAVGYLGQARAQSQSSAHQESQSLYKRLGGYDALAAVTDDFVGRLVTDKQLARFFGVECKRLFNVHMTARFEAKLSETKMAFRRRGDVNDVRLGIGQKCVQAAVVGLDREPVANLLSHQRLMIAHAYNLTSLNSLYLRGMRICDLTASYERDFKHVVHHGPCSF